MFITRETRVRDRQCERSSETQLDRRASRREKARDSVLLDGRLHATEGLHAPDREDNVDENLQLPHPRREHRRLASSNRQRGEAVEPLGAQHVKGHRLLREGFVRRPEVLPEDHDDETETGHAREKARERGRRAESLDVRHHHDALFGPKEIRIRRHGDAVHAEIGGHRLGVEFERHDGTRKSEVFRRLRARRDGHRRRQVGNSAQFDSIPSTNAKCNSIFPTVMRGLVLES